MGRLDGFERPVATPWQRGWYRGAVISEYTAGEKNNVFRTEDRSTTKGDSRQLQLCILAVRAPKNGKVTDDDKKYLNYSVFYRPDSLFDAERVKYVMGLRQTEPKRGAWSDKDAQRDNMSFIALHEVEKAVNQGNELAQADNGGLDVSGVVNSEVDAFLSIFRKGASGYDEEVPKDILQDYFAQEIGWGKDGQEQWFYRIKYLAPAGSMTDKEKK